MICFLCSQCALLLVQADTADIDVLCPGTNGCEIKLALYFNRLFSNDLIRYIHGCTSLKSSICMLQLS